MNDDYIWAIVKGYRMCIDDLISKGIRIGDLEAKADYLFPIIKQNPQKYGLE